MNYWLEYIQLTSQELLPATQDGYCILLCIQGGCSLTDTQQRQTLSSGQLALLSPGNHLQLSVVNSIPAELLLINLSCDLLRQLSTPQTNLLTGFGHRNYCCAVVSAPHSIFMLLQNAGRRLLSLSTEAVAYGQDVFEQSLLSMMTVLILRACISQDKEFKGKLRAHFVLDDIFAYIKNHLAEPMTLDKLSATFYISKAHISREFKRQCGQTVHRYIVKARLEYCCQQLLLGKPVTEIYQTAGFKDYNNFFRTFKAQYSMTPKQYLRQARG